VPDSVIEASIAAHEAEMHDRNILRRQEDLNRSMGYATDARQKASDLHSQIDQIEDRMAVRSRRRGVRTAVTLGPPKRRKKKKDAPVQSDTMTIVRPPPPT